MRWWVGDLKVIGWEYWLWYQVDMPNYVVRDLMSAFWWIYGQSLFRRLAWWCPRPCSDPWIKPDHVLRLAILKWNAASVVGLTCRTIAPNVNVVWTSVGCVSETLYPLDRHRNPDFEFHSSRRWLPCCPHRRTDSLAMNNLTVVRVLNDEVQGTNYVIGAL